MKNDDPDRSIPGPQPIPEADWLLLDIKRRRGTYYNRQWREKVGYPTTRKGRWAWRMEKLVQEDLKDLERLEHGGGKDV